MNIKIPESFPLESVATQLGVRTEAGRAAMRIALENVLLLDGKQLDYGSKNISRFSTFGCVVRMSDKFERIVNLFSRRRKRAVNESVRDSFRDLSNYCIIALMCETHKWPNE